MVAADGSPPVKATKASYTKTDQPSKDENGSSNLMWLGDFDPPVLETIVKPPSLPIFAPTKPVTTSIRKAGQPGETSKLPTELLDGWDVTSMRTTMDTLPDRWTELQWLFQRNQIALWQFDRHDSEIILITSIPSISKVEHAEHLKSISSVGRAVSFNYEYEMNAYKVDSLVTLQLSDDKKSFDGTRRITVLERDKHVPCATMQYALHGTRH